MPSRLNAVGPPVIRSAAPATGPTQSARTAGAQTLANIVDNRNATLKKTAQPAKRHSP